MAPGRSSSAEPTLTIEKMREYYEFYSGKASDIVRQLCFAGIAVVWLVSGNADAMHHDSIVLTRPLLRALFLFLLTLGLDALQYIYGALVWGALTRHREKKSASNTRPVNRAWNWPTLGLYWGKMLGAAFAYAVLAADLVGKIVAK